jgi:AcrR family transcriptional regulator
MAPSDVPLTRDRILATAEEVIRRFGPAKATVVDVAQALGVSHAAVYRHVASKAELRELVVGKWLEQLMVPLREAAKSRGSAPKRLRRFVETLIATKRARAAADPELFAAYRTLAADAKSAVTPHLDELLQLTASIVAAGVSEGTFRRVEPVGTARAILIATLRFHHPAHAAEWAEPGVEKDFGAVWEILMNGLRVASPSRVRDGSQRDSPPRVPGGGLRRRLD